jgi:ABC-type phosphate transport system auxiliary subunit
MTTSINEHPSSKERKDIWVELQSLRQDTQALRTEAYRLRTAGRLDATSNERLRAQQTELERRGEGIIKRCVPSLRYVSGPDLEEAQTFART